ncbi:MAG: undecaprenyl-phosphate glucose phosphotransferase [Bacteroidota bacterium]
MIPKKQRIALRHIALELILLSLCALLVLLAKNDGEISTAILGNEYREAFHLILIFNIVWLCVIVFSRDQSFYTSDHFPEKVRSLLINTFIFVGVISTIAIVFKIEYFNRTSFLLPIFLFAVVNIFILSLLMEWFKRRNADSFLSRVLVIGGGDRLDQVMDFADRLGHSGYRCVGFLDQPKPSYKKQELAYLGEIQQLAEVLNTENIDELFITASSLKGGELKKITKTADFYGVRVNLIPKTLFFTNANFKSYSLDGLPFFKYRQSPLDQMNNYLFKKAFDIVFASIVLLLFAPVLLLIALLIRLDGKGPIFYTPLRKGEGGRIFKCYKFRTMSVCDDPVNGTRSTVKNDPRITKIGKYLRKLDLDEFPQFFNVLKGDMSVVGPRPHRVHLEKDFRKIVNDYMVRHYVKPGITGWAQVNGWRGPTQTVSQKKKRIEHDLWYIENWNFLLDLDIVLRTVFSKKTRRNAF